MRSYLLRISLLGFIAVLTVLLNSGCFQIDTTVKYNDDGSATITERLNFSRRLLDMAKAEGPQLQLTALLQRAAALTRMKSMGTGVSLISHKIQDGKKGSKESISVFKITDLNNFIYASPWLAYRDYADNNAIKWHVKPMYKSRPYGQGSAGCISIEFGHVKSRPKGRARKQPDPPIKPIDAQVYRELGPVFRDALEGFQVKLTFQSYAPVHYKYNSRGQRSRSKSVDILNITDKDLDRYGYNFFENEEIMLDVIRWELGSSDVVSHVKNYSGNTTLPVFTPLGSSHMWWSGGGNLHFRPSRPLFNKFFKGKKLDFAQWGKSPPNKHVLADFAKVGYHPQPSKATKKGS